MIHCGDVAELATNQGSANTGLLQRTCKRFQEAKETGGWSTEDLKLTCETFRERGLFKAYDFTV